ncbi:hypothetical protein [Pedobacter cryoconitis]|uniref:Uncharacterized protein n=1 Tax=Pedobacter cryoconitis TaxID=188932 RepID=A0A7X0MJZ8_9SPHI|nr:hypothetical protein [Pedobacter cryoconitis]MBB6501664.1 hypothetical protein [Pedobacter cryoconitis]
MGLNWYAYIGGTAGDPTLARNYSRIVHGKPGCVFGAFVCAIYSLGGMITPYSPLTPNIQTYIANGLANLVPEPQLPVGSKPYVYMKPSS